MYIGRSTTEQATPISIRKRFLDVAFLLSDRERSTWLWDKKYSVTATSVWCSRTHVNGESLFLTCTARVSKTKKEADHKIASATFLSICHGIGHKLEVKA